MSLRCKGCLTPFDPPKDAATYRCPACGSLQTLSGKPEAKPKEPLSRSTLGFPEIENLPSVPEEEFLGLEKTQLSPPKKKRRPSPPRRRSPIERRKIPSPPRSGPSGRSFLLALLTVIVLFMSWTAFHLFYREPQIQNRLERHILEAYHHYEEGRDLEALKSAEKAKAIDPDSLLVRDLLERLAPRETSQSQP